MRNLLALCASLTTGCLTSTVNEIHEDVALEGDITDVVVAVPSEI